MIGAGAGGSQRKIVRKVRSWIVVGDNLSQRHETACGIVSNE